MTDLFYRPPGLIRFVFRNIIWKNPGNGILLTIDDGPSDRTTAVLEVLDKLNIKAVFFCTGRNIEKHPDEFEALNRSGHKICAHGYFHNNMMLRSSSKNISEVLDSRDIIYSITGEYPAYFRPPYGLFNQHTLYAVKKSGMKMMLWDFMTGDHTGDTGTSRRLIDSYLCEDSIVVMHDNSKSTGIFENVLEHLAERAEERGYVFGSL